MNRKLLLLIISFIFHCCCAQTVDRTLKIILPVTDTIQSDEAFEIRKKAFIKVEEGNYEESLKMILDGIEKFPKDFVLQTNLATLIGDYSGNFSGQKKEMMLNKSKEIFEKLRKEVDGQPKRHFYYFQNEYCYRFALYKEQYNYGKNYVDDYWNSQEWLEHGFSGYYCQGVGAANYARELLKQGDTKNAFDYANKSLIAWAQYFSYDNQYYNAYVHYALALGILGYKDEMKKALHRAAGLINRDLSFHEFKEVIQFFEEIDSKSIVKDKL